MQLRRCGESPGRGTDDVDRTVRGGRSSLEPRTAPSGDAADHIVALARAGPMGRTARPHPANRANPYTDCAMGLLIPVAHNRIIFIAIDFVSGRTPSNIRGRKTAPCGWIDRYLGRNL